MSNDQLVIFKVGDVVVVKEQLVPESDWGPTVSSIPGFHKHRNAGKLGVVTGLSVMIKAGGSTSLVHVDHCNGEEGIYQVTELELWSREVEARMKEETIDDSDIELELSQ